MGVAGVTHRMILLQLIVDGLLLGAVYALFSSGLTLIWGMMNVINFAHGDFVMLAMYVAFFAFTLAGLGPVFFVPVAAILLFGFGVLVYVALVRHVMRGPMLAQIISTFGLALVMQYGALWLFSANFVSLPNTLVGGVYDLGGIRLSAAQLIAGRDRAGADDGHAPAADAHRSSAAGCSLFPRTAPPRRWSASGPIRCRRSPGGWVQRRPGVAGALIALFFYVSPTVGDAFTLIAFVTVCLGGFGSVPGALIAGLVIGVIESLSAFWLGPPMKDVVVYGLFVALLWVRPQGLLGRA